MVDIYFLGIHQLCNKIPSIVPEQTADYFIIEGGRP